MITRARAGSIFGFTLLDTTAHSNTRKNEGKTAKSKEHAAINSETWASNMQPKKGMSIESYFRFI